MMSEEEMIKQLGELLSGLQVPYSMLPERLGKAGPAWLALHRELLPSGWHEPEDYERAIRAVLGR